MSSHADKVRELERAVVEAAVKWERSNDPDFGRVHVDHHVEDAVRALLAARAETCATCEGTGHTAHGIVDLQASQVRTVMDPCPAGCDNGRRRTT